MVVHSSANSSSPTSGLPPGVALVLVVIFLIVDLWVAMRFINDLYQPDRRVNGDKNMWAIIILFGSVLGMLAYVLIGRVE
jgi:Phospholipase_D-nuclease N-terminal